MKKLTLVILFGIALFIIAKFAYDTAVQFMNDQFPPAVNGILVVTHDSVLTKNWDTTYSTQKETCPVDSQEEVVYGEKKWIFGVLQFHVSSKDGGCFGWAPYSLFERKQ